MSKQEKQHKVEVIASRGEGWHPYPATLGFDMQQLQGVGEVGPGCGAPDHNRCRIICPCSLSCSTALKDNNTFHHGLAITQPLDDAGTDLVPGMCMVSSSTAQHSTAQHSTAQHSTAQHSAAQRPTDSTQQHNSQSTAQHSSHRTAQHHNGKTSGACAVHLSRSVKGPKPAASGSAGIPNLGSPLAPGPLHIPRNVSLMTVTTLIPCTGFTSSGRHEDVTI